MHHLVSGQRLTVAVVLCTAALFASRADATESSTPQRASEQQLPAVSPASAPGPQLFNDKPRMLGAEDYNLADPSTGWRSYVATALWVPAVNVMYWLPAKYVMRADYAQINWDTMRGGIEHGMVFDEDSFATNQIGHPYQGGSYFNTARAAGLSFWEATPYVAAGSLMWEFFMESGPACCYPSINDFVTTTAGGIAVGEVLWRLSNFILDDSTDGTERAVREGAVLLINPPYGLYRLSSGDAFASGAAPLRPQALHGEFTLGGSLFGSDGDPSDFATIGRLRLRHGTVAELPSAPQAFDYFTLDLAGGIARGELVGATFDVMGLLHGRKFSAFGTKNIAVGTGLDFDFFRNVLASLGQSSVGPVAIGEFQVSPSLSLFARVSLMAAFGAISSDHPDIREYNLGFGVTNKVWLELRHAAWGEVYFKADRYWIHTESGKAGDELAGVLDFGGTVHMNEYVGVGMHVLMGDKRGRYQHYDNTLQQLYMGEGYVAWLF